MHRRDFLRTAAAGAAGPLASTAAGAGFAPREFHFRHDFILGTSLDLTVFASDAGAAEACEDAVLGEVERLRRILSAYDPAGELSAVNRSSHPVRVSAELVEGLRFYEYWTRRTGGAFSARLDELIRLWREAARTGVEPDPIALAAAAERARGPGWIIDEAALTVSRIGAPAINVDSVGKGYVVGRALAAGRNAALGITGVLLDVGGDIAVSGDCPGSRDGDWPVGIAYPRRSEDNVVPALCVRLRDRAIATSAGYERSYVVGGRAYPHILDPRNGRPAGGALSATVIAPDSITAGALATTLCVLPVAEGLALVGQTPGVECLLVDSGGALHRSEGFAAYEAEPVEAGVAGSPLAVSAQAGAGVAAAAADPWPDKYEVRIGIALVQPTTGKKIRRPYVAVWIEDAAGKPVRTLEVWGNEAKYQKDLTVWWRFAGRDSRLIRAVTRATRAPGRYRLVWDGADDRGKPVDRGTYTVKVEVHREYGRHVTQSGAIECRAQKASTTLAKTDENDDTVVEYGSKAG